MPKYLLQIIILTSFITCSSPTQEKKGRKQDVTFSISPSFTIDTVKDVFNIPEIHVKQSPDAPQLFQLTLNENVTGFDVSPEGGIAAVIINEPGKEDNIRIWDYLQNKLMNILPNPEKYNFIDIAWHPDAGSLYAIAKKNNQYYILRYIPTSGTWKYNSIYSSKDELKRLVFGPRPFVPSENWGNIYYRLFFGIKNEQGNFRIATINEKGEHFFQVVGPEKSITYFKYEDWDTDLFLSNMTAEWALPIAFHPAGHQIIWENKKNNFLTANYNSQIWDTCHPLNFKVPSNGSVYPAPNGVGLLHWNKNKNGIALYPINSSSPITQISQYTFQSPPKFTPDGKGVIGITHTDDKNFLNYVPINLPLCDVVNAWMFVDTEEELGLFEKHFGLFRPTAHEQLYQFYETERYGQCGGYDFTTPIRPYLVTTDVFWEIFGAAFQGIFIVNEREQAIPAFREFVSSADKFYKQNQDTNFWMPVFNTLLDLLNNNALNQEVVKIKKEEVSYSEVLRREFNFSELKPRGHYTSSDEMQNYFRAFKYFTTCIYNDWGKLAVSSEIPELLNKLPMEVRQYAIKWIESYRGFISTPKNKIVWNDLNFKPPSYCKYPDTTPKIFPLSWGFDNEILYSTVYHENFPPEEQITGNGSERLLPSGIDIAASFGNGLADSLLTADYKDYPNLHNVIRNLHEKFIKFEKKFSTSDNLYDRWISALAVQWADSVMSVNGENDKNIWKAKRLQTGLASWTTLRHATGLVNERGAAECGEGGLWEYLWLRAPRGYVEPDPYTFETIAGMFDVTADFVANKLKNKELKSKKTSLYDGIIKWLKSSAEDCRTFKLIAEKEKRGESLSSQEYKTIFGIGSIAEYAFLVFKSLSKNDNGIANPDPMPKIYDVSGNGPLGYLMAAVGYPIDWDYITPFYGRHQIVKGAVYSYYEFSSRKLLNDKEWLDDIKKREITTWTKPFFTEAKNIGQPVGVY